jgi:hypothetical protein
MVARNYDEWEKTQGFSPVSPEASAAEEAWDAAKLSAKQLGIADQLTPLNEAVTRNMTDSEFLQHINICDDYIVVELARRMQRYIDEYGED